MGLGGSHEFFYGRIGKDGRIFIPKAVLFMARGKTENPAGYFVDIIIEPAQNSESALLEKKINERYLA